MMAQGYDKVITVQYPVDTQDTAGQPIPAWTELFTARAAIDPLSMREYMATQGMGSAIDYKIRIRARPPTETRISGKMRIVCGTQIFEIVGPVPSNDDQIRAREVQLLCREVF